MNIETFRNCVNALRKPRPYFPVLTESKGALNLVIGSLQLAASQVFKLSSQERYYNNISQKHVKIGTEAIRLGLKEFLPGAILVTSGILMYKKWIHVHSGEWT